jgi:hypothetical protein
MTPLKFRRILVSVALSLSLFFAVSLSAQPNSVPAATVASQASSPQIPNGTILPVRLDHGFSARNAQPGQTVTARIMQTVPLPGGGNIPAGATVSGKILSVTPAANGAAESVSLSFHQLIFDHQKFVIAVDLRAIASFMEVNWAQVPDQALGFGTPATWADSTQIGGDSVYGAGGEVTDGQSHPVGKALYNGVLVHVRTQPGAPCRGSLDADDRLQALWVFSSDACGVYGMRDVSIAHAGRDEPAGVITLAAPAGALKVRAGSGMLLRVTAAN